MKKRRGFRKKIDERERMIAYKAEHWGFWAMYLLSAAACIAEGFILGKPLKEWFWMGLILITGSVVTLVGMLRKGVFDCMGFQARPATYFLWSVGSAAVFTVLFCIGKVRQMPEYFGQGHLAALLTAGAIFFLSVFVLCFLGLAGTGWISNHKKRRLNRELDEADEADAADEKEES